MSNVLNTKILRRLRRYSVCLSMLLSTLSLFADGSKDLFPYNNGGRAYMYSNLGRNATTIQAWPFADLGTHYVYAKEGEFIAIASSAMGYGNGGIRITRPNGTSFDYTGTTGRILSRTNELAGPRLPGGGGSTYVPYEVEVLSGQEGVWKIEFLPVGPENTTTQAYNPGAQAADTWTQNTSNVANNSLIAAWDVSVRSNTSGPWQWVAGRVYVNVLNLYIPQDGGSNYPQNRSFGGVYGVNTLENEVVDDNIGGGQTATHSDLNCTGFNQEWVVEISGSGYSDEITWELRDADDNVVLSGGPYSDQNQNYNYSDSVESSNGPFEFFIETQGTFNDNDPSYTVTCESEELDCGSNTCGAVVYVLTKDGYVYKVNNNGNYGVGFTFFSNNKGFIDKDNDDEPLYKSVNSSGDITDYVHEPTTADDGNDNITNKIFYTIPADDMPGTSDSDAVPGGETWLRVDRIPPAVYDVTVIGVDGTEGQISNKGGTIVFQTDNLASRYTITIMPPEDDPTAFEPLTLTGPAQEGENTVEWDGTDGNGDELPEGELTALIGVALQTAEVHFPYIDMEINPQGIIIELLNEDLNGVESDVVYWDDSDIDNANDGAPQKPVPVDASHPTIPEGISSTTNGHKWGTYGGSSGSGNDGTGNNGFGNNKSIDTWSFVDGEAQTFTADIVVKIADLEVETLTSDYCDIVSVGDSWTYTANIINNGPSDVLTNTDPGEGPLSEGTLFQLYVPDGININPASVIMTSLCAEIVGTPTFVDGVYSARVDMTNGCEATFTLPATAVGGIQTNDGYAHVWATLLRPDDFTDPDATNDDPETPPTDPFFEAEGVGVNASDDLFLNPGSFDLSETNNIKTNDCVEMHADLDIVKTVTPSSGHDIDDVVTFTITVDNNGESDATNVEVMDLLPSRFGYVSHNASQGTYNQFSGLWTIGNIDNGDSEVLTIDATINATGGSQINTATVSADEYDPDLDNNEDTAQTDAAINTTIEITKTGNRTGGGGNTATFTLVVTNTGNNTATNIVVTDDLSGRYNNNSQNYEVSHGSVSFSGTQSRNIEWTIGSLLPGSVAYMVFTVSINNGGGSYNNEVEAVGDNTNTATDDVTPSDTGTDRDLDIEKLVDNATPDVGDTVEFTINLQRLTGGTVNGVQVTDVIPIGFVITGTPSASQGTYNATTGVWNVGTINSGATRTLTIEAIVQPPTGEVDEYRNITAITAAGDAEDDPTNKIADVEVTPLLADLEISKTASEESVKINNEVAYTITIYNNGPNTAVNVVVSDILPAECEWVDDTPSQGTYNSGTGVWSVGNLANDTSATLVINATVESVGIITNEADVTSDTYDRFLWNNSDSVIITGERAYLITNPMIRSRVIAD